MKKYQAVVATNSATGEARKSAPANERRISGIAQPDRLPPLRNFPTIIPVSLNREVSMYCNACGKPIAEDGPFLCLLRQPCWDKCRPQRR